MERYKLECLEDLLTVAGLNPLMGHYDRSRSVMFAKPLNVMAKRKPQYIYTTSQLIELFAVRGNAIFHIPNREPVIIRQFEKSKLITLMSTIPRGETFKITINALSGAKRIYGDLANKTMIIRINSPEFKMLSANSLKSAANLGPLFDEWNVPLFASQRRSMGLDLKK